MGRTRPCAVDVSGGASMTAAPDLATLGPVGTWQWLVAELQVAATSSRHGFHLLTVATLGLDGAPDARTVVLRHVDAVRREIRFHTDARGPKAMQLRRDPRVALHWYDPACRVQLRAAAEAVIHQDDDVAAAAWGAAQPMSRACYAATAAPGTPLAAFAPAPPAPDPGDAAARDHFAVVVCRYSAIELLALHAAGHQRVRLHVGHDAVTWTVLAP